MSTDNEIGPLSTVAELQFHRVRPTMNSWRKVLRLLAANAGASFDFRISVFEVLTCLKP